MPDFRRFTNVDDLLDDGIENNSDIATKLASNVPPAPPPDETSIRIREETLSKVEAEESLTRLRQRKSSYSRYGVILGVILSLAGIISSIHPSEILVEHARIRYLATTHELVSPFRARIYGVSLAAIGIALVAFSLYRPKS